MLAQWLGPGEWIALATMIGSLAASMAYLIWNASRANTKLEYVADTLDTIHDERKGERRERNELDSRLFAKLENHEGRIIRLESCDE